MSDKDDVLAAIGQLAGRIDQLRDAVSAELGNVRSELSTELGKVRTDLMERLDRQQDLLTVIREDVGVNMAATLKTRDENRLTRDDLFDLTKQVSLIHRRLMQLETWRDNRDAEQYRKG